MGIKDTLSARLQRLTGYRPTRETPEQRRQAIEAAARRAASRARKASAERHRRRVAELQARHAAKLQRLRERHRSALQAQAERHAAKLARIRADIEARRQEQLRREQDRLERQEQERSAALKRLEEERARGDDLPAHLDDEMRQIIAHVRPRTMTHPAKLEALIEATRYVLRDQIPGAIVECGVWRGGSMQAVAMALLKFGVTDRQLHLFDTFEGMPPPTPEDTRTVEGDVVSAAELLASADKDSRMWAIAGLDDVKAGMAESGYPSDRVHYHVGLVEDTTPGEAPEQIAILRLDTDWYASTLHELEVLYDRLVPGGVLILDDYGDWDGARRATEEWLARMQPRLFLIPMATGRIAVKPLG